jgi:hypothetical protein
MADDNILSEALGAVTGGNAESGLEGMAIKGAEGMLQEKTGIDISSMLGGGQSSGTQNSDDSSN